MLSDWYLQWDTDGCQWDVLEVNMYEQYPPKGYAMHTSTWEGCLKFSYEHLLRKEYSVKHITIYCDEGRLVITKDILIDIMREEYPEDFI